MSAHKIIHVNIVIHTDRLLRDYPNPGKEVLEATAIDHNYLYITATDDTGTHGGTSGSLSLQITPDDEVRFYTVSEYNNSHNPVILSWLLSRSRERIFFQPYTTQDSFLDVETVVPEADTSLKLRTPNPKVRFSFARNIVKRTGTETLSLQFSAFDANLNLHGYFHSELKITATH